MSDDRNLAASIAGAAAQSQQQQTPPQQNQQPQLCLSCGQPAEAHDQYGRCPQGAREPQQNQQPVSPLLNGICMNCHRPASAHEDGRCPTSRQTPEVPPLTRWVREHRRASVVIGMAVLVLGIVVAVVSGNSSSNQQACDTYHTFRTSLQSHDYATARSALSDLPGKAAGASPKLKHAADLMVQDFNNGDTADSSSLSYVVGGLCAGMGLSH